MENITKKGLKVLTMIFIFIFCAGAYQNWTFIASGCVPGIGENNIVVDKHNRVHIVWIRPPMPPVDDSSYIRYQRSLNGGETWQSSSIAAIPGHYFSLASNRDNNIYLIYYGYSSSGVTTGSTCFRRSVDGGTTWSSSETLSTVYADTALKNGFPNVAASGGDTVYAIWLAYNPTGGIDDTLFFRRSLDGGNTWEKSKPLAAGTLWPYPLITASGKYVYVFYNAWEGILYKRSVDYGITWTQSVLINTNVYSAVAGSGNHEYLCFGPYGQDGKPKIYYFNTHWNEDRWDSLAIPLMGDSTRLTGSGPEIAALGNKLAVSWYEIRMHADTANKSDSDFFYVAGSADSGRQWLPPVLLGILPDSIGRGVGSCPRVALDDSGYVHILGYGEASGKQGIVYRKIKFFSDALIEKNTQPPFFLSSLPNPTKRGIEITFSIPTASMVTVQIFDLTGRLVRTLLNERKEGNSLSILWNGKDYRGKRVGSGSYLCRLQVGKSSFTRKIILIN